MNGTDRIPSAPDDPLAPIQMLWVRGNLSRMELLSVRSFLAHGHPVHLYTYEPGDNLPAGATIMDATKILPPELVPPKQAAAYGKGGLSGFANCFRYNLLAELGGWWADTDFVCLRSWRFARPALTASTYESGFGRIANPCVLRFPPNHPVMRACQAAVANLDIQQLEFGQTGPTFLHQHLEKLGLLPLTEAPSVFCPVPWRGSWQLLRPRWKRFTFDELKQRLRRPHLTMRFTAATVSTHLWHETWRRAGWDKDAHFHPSCLYERYQHRWNPVPAS